MKPFRSFLLVIFVGGMSLMAPSGARAAVMVSNLAETLFSSSPLAFGFWFGNRFVTDGSADSFTLDNVVWDLGDASDTSGNFFAGIYSDQSSQPGVQLELLSGTPNPAGAGDYTFTSAGLSLAPNTSYWIVAGVTSGSGSYSWNLTASNSHAGPWSIPSTATHIYSFDQGAIWQTASDGFPRQFSVSATAVPEPANLTVIFTAVILCFAVWSGRQRRNRRSGVPPL